jgi:hypothetical protein
MSDRGLIHVPSANSTSLADTDRLLSIMCLTPGNDFWTNHYSSGKAEKSTQILLTVAVHKFEFQQETDYLPPQHLRC